MSDAVCIVNDRPLISVSSHPNDLLPVSPSSFLGQQLAPYTPICRFHDRGDLRRDYCIMSPLLISSGNLGSRVIYRRCKAAVNGGLLVKILLKAN